VLLAFAPLRFRTAFDRAALSDPTCLAATNQVAAILFATRLVARHGNGGIASQPAS